MISEQIRQKAREWHIHNDFEYWSDEEVAAFAESLLSGGAAGSRWQEARHLWKKIIGDPPRMLNDAEHDLDDLLAGAAPPAASGGQPAQPLTDWDWWFSQAAERQLQFIGEIRKITDAKAEMGRQGQLNQEKERALINSSEAFADDLWDELELLHLNIEMTRGDWINKIAPAIRRFFLREFPSYQEKGSGLL